MVHLIVVQVGKEAVVVGCEQQHDDVGYIVGLLLVVSAVALFVFVAVLGDVVVVVVPVRDDIVVAFLVVVVDLVVVVGQLVVAVGRSVVLVGLPHLLLPQQWQSKCN